MKCVYVMESDGLFKIGVAANAGSRLLSLRTGNPKIKLVYESEKISNAYKVENILHRSLEQWKVDGEWFSFPRERELIEEVQSVIKKYGETTEEKKKASKHYQDLLNWVLEPTIAEIARLDAEINAIKKENEKLAEELINMGWTPDEVQQIIDNAEKSVVAA